MMGSRIVAAAVVAVVLLIGAGAGVYLLVQNTRFSARQNQAVGAGVTVTGSKVPSDIKAVSIKTALPSYPYTQPISSALEMTPGGTLPAPVTLRFRLSRQLKAGDMILGATSEKSGDPWTLVQANVSSDGWYAEIQTGHLSRWVVLGVDLQAAINDFKKEIVDAVTADVTTTADKPHCENEQQARQDNYSITSSAKDTLYWCFGLQNGERVLKIVNRMRYPLEVGYPGFTLKHQGIVHLDLDQLARFFTDKTIILYPFEEADFTVSLPDSGGHASIKTEYSGLAESLYQLEVGVISAVNTLTRFGATEGISIKGALDTSKFGTVVKYADKFLKIRDCLNVFSDLRAGSVLSHCFSPADVLTVYGWKALPLAAVMAAAPIIEFFTSEFQAIRDQFTGGSAYEVLVSRINPQTAFTPYVGQWYVHGSTLTINADRTGSQTWNAGPCRNNPSVLIDDGPPCAGNAKLAFTVNADGSITAVYQSVWYTQRDNVPAPSYFKIFEEDQRAGDSFQLRFDNPYLLHTTWLGRRAYLNDPNNGNPYWCAVSHSSDLCGA